MTEHRTNELPKLDAIEKYASLGVKLHMTELDVSVFAHEDRRTELTSQTADMLERQAERYGQFFKLLGYHNKGVAQGGIRSIDGGIVYLKIHFNFEDSVDLATFYYSLDGAEWKP